MLRNRFKFYSVSSKVILSIFLGQQQLPFFLRIVKGHSKFLIGEKPAHQTYDIRDLSIDAINICSMGSKYLVLLANVLDSQKSTGATHP